MLKMRLLEILGRAFWLDFAVTCVLNLPVMYICQCSAKPSGLATTWQVPVDILQYAMVGLSCCTRLM